MPQLLLALFALLFSTAALAQQPKPYDCGQVAAHRQFDFWVGNWEVTDASGDTVYGHNQISQRDRGCLLLEEWKSSSGGTGTSINYFNPDNGQWHQHWVDAGASIIHTAGGLEEGSMVMQGSIYYLQAARKANFRARWTPLEDGRVRQFFEEQNAEGEWQAWFEGFYRPVDQGPVCTASSR